MRKHLCRKQGIKTSNKRQEESKVKKINKRKKTTHKTPVFFPDSNKPIPLMGVTNIRAYNNNKKLVHFLYGNAAV